MKFENVSIKNLESAEKYIIYRYYCPYSDFDWRTSTGIHSEFQDGEGTEHF